MDFRRITNIGSDTPEPPEDVPQQNNSPAKEFSSPSKIIDALEPQHQESLFEVGKQDQLAFEVPQEPLSSWDQYTSLEFQIQNDLDSLPPDLQAQEKARFDQLQKSVQPLMDMTSFHLPDQQQQIPEQVLQSLQSFLTEVQGLLPAGSSPSPGPSPEQQPQISGNLFTQPSGISGLGDAVPIPVQQGPLGVQKPNHFAFEPAPTSLDTFKNLESQIDAAINNLPPEQQAQMRSRFDDMKRFFDAILNMAEGSAAMKQASASGGLVSGDQSNIPDDVLQPLIQQLRDFLAEVQSQTPPAPAPDAPPAQ